MGCWVIEIFWTLRKLTIDTTSHEQAWFAILFNSSDLLRKSHILCRASKSQNLITYNFHLFQRKLKCTITSTFHSTLDQLWKVFGRRIHKKILGSATSQNLSELCLMSWISLIHQRGTGGPGVIQVPGVDGVEIEAGERAARVRRLPPPRGRQVNPPEEGFPRVPRRETVGRESGGKSKFNVITV